MNEDVISWSADDMLEVTIKQPDDFLKVRETLTRIGVASRKGQDTISIVSYFTQTR